MSAEDWAVYKELEQERRDKSAERRDLWNELFYKHKMWEKGWRQCHPTHFQYQLLGDTLDFWPGPGKWRWRNKTYRTGRVMTFIKEREERDNGT